MEGASACIGAAIAYREMGRQAEFSLDQLRDGHGLRLLGVTDRQDSGHEYTYWFDAQTPMEALDDALKGDKKKSK